MALDPVIESHRRCNYLAALEHILISRGFDRFAAELDLVDKATATKRDENTISRLAYAYRAHALAHPSLYRLMTERTLDRTQLSPGSEHAAMSALLQYFDESPESHDRARAVWAAAHGLVSLELADRFPPGTDLTGAWEALIDAFSH